MTKTKNNILEKPNLYYVLVDLSSNHDRSKQVVCQARFAELSCRLDAMQFNKNGDLLYIDGRIELKLELAGIDTAATPICDLSFRGHWLNGKATFEAAKKQKGMNYFYTHGNANLGAVPYIDMECFGITLKDVENALKNYDVQVQTYFEGKNEDIECEEHDIKVNGYYWDGTKPICKDVTQEIYFNILTKEIEYEPSDESYPSQKACTKANSIICYRFND